MGNWSKTTIWGIILGVVLILHSTLEDHPDLIPDDPNAQIFVMIIKALAIGIPAFKLGDRALDRRDVKGSALSLNAQAKYLKQEDEDPSPLA